jgi:type I restriction enzyme S subunit
MNPSTPPNRDSQFRDDAHLGRVPADWKTAKLGQLLCECQYGLSRQLADVGKYPVFRMNNIKDGRMVARNLAYIDLPEVEFARYRLSKGDVLLNRTNSLELVGKVGIFDLEGDFLFASYLIRLAVKNPNDSRFVNYFLNSYQGQKRIRSKVTPAISQANVNTRSLKSLWLPQPSPDEQRLIADTLDELHDLTEAYRKKIAALEMLQKALMAQLLTGRMKPDGTLRHQCEFQETKVGLLPKSWTAARVKNFGPVSTGKTPPTVNEANFGQDYPFITPGDMGATNESPVG